MKFEELIKSILNEFNECWNDFNFEKIETFLSNDVEIQSPKIKEIYPDNIECKIRGKKQLIEYWKKYRTKHGEVLITQKSFEKKDRIIITYNQVINSNLTIKETIKINEYGKIQKLIYDYHFNE